MLLPRVLSLIGVELLVVFAGCILVNARDFKVIRPDDQFRPTPVSGVANRTFTVDYENNVFLLDGKPFNYVSGSIHYFRVPPPYWRDRLRKLRAAGFNAVQTYIPWNEVEPSPGSFRINDDGFDVETFMKTAAEEGLFVILRPGPYICAEYEAGGLPWWLLSQTPKIRLRTSDPVYMQYVEDYFRVLLPRLAPFLYRNGGPVLMVQVENEYGLYPACDKRYMEMLRDMFWKHLGNETVLFTTDPVDGFNCGRVNGTLTTVDFGVLVDVQKPFQELRKLQPKGPLVNSEFYPGWFDLWSFPHARVSAKATMQAFDQFLNNQTISVNFYMFHGGTNFGFSAGGKTDVFGGYRPVPTSYDYDAPLNEYGELTEKYHALKDALNPSKSRLVYFDGGKFELQQPMEIENVSKKAYGRVPVSYKTSLFDARHTLCTESLEFVTPHSMEQINQGYGFLLYEKTIDFMTCDPVVLHVPKIHDRGYVLVDGVLVGVLDRTSHSWTVPISTLRVNSSLAILVENQGRIGFGSKIFDSKGILSSIYLSCGAKFNVTLNNWYHLPLPLNNTEFFGDQDAGQKQNKHVIAEALPAFFEGELIIDDENPADTFVRLDGFTKGVVIVNDVILGRYWPTQGPQVTLYVPGAFLTNSKPNKILILELEYAPVDCVSLADDSWNALDGVGDCYIEFVDQHVIDGPTPFDLKRTMFGSSVAERGWQTKL